MNSYQFPPLKDRVHFPLLTAGDELPCGHLMGCQRLVFFAAEDLAAIPSVILKEGMEWHLYGDTRWPALSSWLEINTSPAGFSGYSGVLVMTYEIPDDEADTFDWIARNGPLSELKAESEGLKYFGRKNLFFAPASTSSSMQLVSFHFDLKTLVKNGIANRPLG